MKDYTVTEMRTKLREVMDALGRGERVQVLRGGEPWAFLIHYTDAAALALRLEMAEEEVKQIQRLLSSGSG